MAGRREPETHEPRQFVEGLPGRIVDGLAQYPVLAPTVYQYHLAVATRGQQHHGRRPEVVESRRGANK